MEYMHGGDIYTYENVTDYSVNLNPFGPGEEVLFGDGGKSEACRGVSGQQKPETQKCTGRTSAGSPGISDFWKWSGRTDLFC